MSYLQYLLLSLAAFGGSFLFGKLFLGLLSIKFQYPYQSLFLQSLVGICSLSLATSLISTKLMTIQIVSVVVIAFAFFLRSTLSISEPNPESITSKRNSKALLEVLICSLIVFSIRFFSFYHENGLFSITHPDYSFYARLSNYLLKFGKENLTGEPFFYQEYGSQPYHYFELWLTAALTFVSGLNVLVNLMAVTYSLLTVLVWIGIMACVEQIKKNVTFLDKLVGFFLLFLTGLYVPLYDQSSFLSVASVFSVNGWNYSKILTIYLFLLLTILFFLKGSKKEALCFSLILPIAYAATAPGILVGIFVWVIIDHLFYHRDIVFLRQALFYIIVVALGIIGFYMLTSFPQTDSKINSLNQALYIRTFVNVIGGTVIQISLLYAPFLILGLVAYRKKLLPFINQSSYVWLFPLCFIFSLLSWATLHFMADSVQLFSNLSISLINIVIILFTFSLKPWLKSAIFVLVLLINFPRTALQSLVQSKYPGYSSAYVEKVCQQLSTVNPIGAFLKNTSYESIFSKNHHFSVLGQSLLQCRSDLNPVSLSVFDIPIDSVSIYASQEEDMVKRTSFYKFVYKQKESGTFSSIAQSQLDFIKQYRIEYLLLEPKVDVPPHLKPLADQTTVDSLTGEKFILLKKP
jgi:hypothetical protein